MPEDLILESLVVENFRSIHGEVVVPLNAPVVLIHGPNGTGKSSVMTALALALAGPTITDIAEPKHLVHHDMRFAAITLGTSAGPTKLRIGPEDSAVGAGVLEPTAAAFFAERCYLEQTKLGGLLERYQETARGAAESALTRFVKELLRLDELDALVDGLAVAGDVRRVDGELQTFKVWRAERPRWPERITAVERSQEAIREDIARIQSSLELQLGELRLDRTLDDDRILEALDQRGDQAALARVEVLARRVAELSRRREQFELSKTASTADDAAQRFSHARERHKAWREQHGDTLAAVIESLRVEFPRLPSLETVSPSQVYDQANEVVAGERKRIAGTLAADDETRAREEQIAREVVAAEERLNVLDRELADETVGGAFGELARVLADLAPRLTDDICPVCGRDFAEVSAEPLSAHLAAEIARLSARAGQLQSAAKARVQTTGDLRRLQRDAARTVAQRLPAGRRASEEQRLARLDELSSRLREHEDGAHQGGEVMREVTAAEGALSEALRRDRARAGWIEDRDQLAAELDAEFGFEAGSDDVDAMVAAVDRRRLALEGAHERHLDVTRLLEERRERRAVAEGLAQQHADLEAERAKQADALDAVEQRMLDARALLHKVESVRRATITRVFNSALNDVWARLFVRLAPDEEYVPAFAPPSSHGPLKIELVTRRRDGTPAGSPSEMLSAGNLNTAALTLFLALHLSVRRRVPWLLLDDPVQSMDEIHIAQFAALLRTLTQQAPQRRVVLAVHERALFEYLALELTPASSDGGLVTVELRRQRGGGDSTARPTTLPYALDPVLTAA